MPLLQFQQLHFCDLTSHSRHQKLAATKREAMFFVALLELSWEPGFWLLGLFLTKLFEVTVFLWEGVVLLHNFHFNPRVWLGSMTLVPWHFSGRLSGPTVWWSISETLQCQHRKKLHFIVARPTHPLAPSKGKLSVGLSGSAQSWANEKCTSMVWYGLAWLCLSR